MALAGLLTAFSAVLMVLSCMIETNSLFLICAASFCVGIAIREWGIRMGFAFLAAGTLVNFMVTPNKFYCLTFLSMGSYLVLSEFLWEKIAAKSNMKNRTLALWIGKYVIFNCIYIPGLIMFQKSIFTTGVSEKTLIGVMVLGQAALFVYDRAYLYFQGAVWGKIRGRFMD